MVRSILIEDSKGRVSAHYFNDRIDALQVIHGGQGRRPRLSRDYHPLVVGLIVVLVIVVPAAILYFAGVRLH